MTITAWLTAAIIAAFIAGPAGSARAGDPTRSDPRVAAGQATLAREPADTAVHPEQSPAAQAHARRMSRWRAFSKPAAWVSMLLGLAIAGAVLRRRR
jgi:hypothetical protein